MFDDLNNQSLNVIPMQKAKAYPSVNSPNDGGFNSEENMRWHTKAITTKPFIIGQTDEQVNASFGSNGAAGDGVYTAPGVFSIDGYIFKLANRDDISFDDNSRETFMVNNTQNIQRFVQGLTNQGTTDAIETDFKAFAFYDYNPDNFTSPYTTLKDNWNLAYKNGTCIGYICNKYTGTYREALSVGNITIGSGSSAVTKEFVAFGDLVESNDLKAEVVDFQITSVDDIQNNYPSYVGKKFAIKNGSGDNDPITIYYPLYFKDYKEWKSDNLDYETSQRVQFDDIFGFVFFYGTEESDSKSYPTTGNVFLDIDQNAPLENLSFTDCLSGTLPSNIYDFESLYDNSTSKRYDSSDFTGISSTSFNSGILTTLFDIKSWSDISNIYPPNAEKIHENTLKYYCLKLNSTYTAYQKTYNSIKVPVAFMTSEGSLCPDGFVYRSKQTSNFFPVEGYVHFIKRIYLINHGVADPEETDIQTVTVQDLCADSGFITSIYNNLLAQPMSFYIHLAYSALMDDVVMHNYDVSTDYMMMKSAACGTKLYAEKGSDPSIEQDEQGFSVYQTYTYNSDMTTRIQYRCNLTSDNAKFQGAVYGDPYIEPEDCDISITLYEQKDFGNDKVLAPLYIEDPINYIKRCSNNGTAQFDEYGIVHNVAFYKINGASMTTVNKVLTNTTSGIIDNLAIDKFLAPKRVMYQRTYPTDIAPLDSDKFSAILGYHTMLALSIQEQYSDSMLSGLNLRWKQNCWRLTIPHTLSINKDNLGYLRSLNLEKPSEYAGAEFHYRFPKDLTNDELFLCNLIISSEPVVGAFDIETCDRTHDITSEYSKRRRESYIHFNKLYGDNFCSLDEQIVNIVNKVINSIMPGNTLETLINDVNTLNTDVGTLQEDVGTLQETVSAQDSKLTAINQVQVLKEITLPNNQQSSIIVSQTAPLAIRTFDVIPKKSDPTTNGIVEHDFDLGTLSSYTAPLTVFTTQVVIDDETVVPGSTSYFYNDNIKITTYFKRKWYNSDNPPVQQNQAICVRIENLTDVDQTDIMIYVKVYETKTISAFEETVEEP